MATLAQTVSATPPNLESDLWTISADLSDAVDYLQVESEIVRVVGNFPAQYQRATATTSVPKIRVERAAGGTTAASHADGTTLTPVIPPSSGGGGAAEAGTAVFKVTGVGSTTGRIFIGDVDPANDPAHPEYPPILEGEPWIDTSFGPPYSNKERDAFDGWVIGAVVFYDALGVTVGQVRVYEEGASISVDGASVTVNNDTLGGPKVVITGPDASILLDSAGNIILGTDAGYWVEITPDHAALSGLAQSIELTATALKVTGLPTADPATADGALWLDSGVLTISS